MLVSVYTCQRTTLLKSHVTAHYVYWELPSDYRPSYLHGVPLSDDKTLYIHKASLTYIEPHSYIRDPSELSLGF